MKEGEVRLQYKDADGDIICRVVSFAEFDREFPELVKGVLSATPAREECPGKN